MRPVVAAAGAVGVRERGREATRWCLLVYVRSARPVPAGALTLGKLFRNSLAFRMVAPVDR